MAKRAYLIDEDGICRKVKKKYLVDEDGIYRRVKKAYITIDGVWRPCWNAEEAEGTTV